MPWAPLRRCHAPGCARRQDAAYCPAHALTFASRNHGGVSRQARGYGAAHVALRARWAALVGTGTVACARCHLVIPAGAPWDLGHTADRTGYTGPEHASCNRADGARRANVAAAAAR